MGRSQNPHRDPHRALGYDPSKFAKSVARMFGLQQSQEAVAVVTVAPSASSNTYVEDDDPRDAVGAVERLNTCGGKNHKPKFTNQSRRRALAARRARR